MVHLFPLFSWGAEVWGHRGWQRPDSECPLVSSGTSVIWYLHSPANLVRSLGKLGCQIPGPWKVQVPRLGPRHLGF